MRIDRSRYQRQMLLPQVGQAGQERLAGSRVALVGLGGLGCPASLYLAGAGVGQLDLIDHDRVALSNLHRQINYRVNHLGLDKAGASQRQLYGLNPDIAVRPSAERLTPANIDRLLGTASVILDCTDNAETRYLINDYALDRNKTLISGAANGFTGQLLVMDFSAERPQACYACVYPDREAMPRDSCDTLGVMGPILGIMGAMQAMEAIHKCLAPEAVRPNRLIELEAHNWQQRRIQLAVDPQCGHCG